MECAACHTSLPDDALFCLRCGTRAPERGKPQPEDPIRAALRKALGQQYDIQRLLGRGGMGAVYLATETALEREVAIKVLPPDRGVTKDSRDRFRGEARTAARLSHPNIVPLYTFGDVDGTLYFVMGYVKGESLAARLKREGRLPVEESRRILIEIAHGPNSSNVRLPWTWPKARLRASRLPQLPGADETTRRGQEPCQHCPLSGGGG
jgi:serine/threonine protein kinase